MQFSSPVLLLLLLVISSQWAEGANVLTTNCNGHCGQFTPCVVTNDDVNKASTYSCLPNSTAQGNATFFFNFGREVNAIGTMELNPSTTKISCRAFADGNNTDVERGEVANVEFDSNFVVDSAGVTHVEFVGLNLSSVVGHLSSISPGGTTQLHLVNTLLKEFPTIPLLSFQSLSHMNLDSNLIEKIDTSAYSSSFESLSLQDNEMRTFQGYFPKLQILILSHNFFTAIPEGVYHLTELKTLKMTHNAPLSRNFTTTQANFLRKLTWDLKEEDFVDLSGCDSSLYEIHGVSVCITDGSSLGDGQNIRDNTLSRIAVERKLYDYESYACPGRYSGGVLAGCIVGTIAFMLVVGFFVWRWQKQKQSRGGPRSSSTKVTDDSYVSVWQDPQLLAIQMKADEIEDVRKIGGGAFADVWLVKYRGTQLLASKRLRKVHETQQTTQNFLKEIKMAAKFDHPNVVKLVGAAWTVESDLQALSEYMVGGDVRDFLIYPQTPRTWTARKLQIATDVIEALVYLHSFIPPVVHRDLKSRNILLSREMRAKLTDFGVSRIMSEENTMTQGVGTSRWEAPEVLAGKEDYNQAADIFSFGVVLSELDTHAIPYDDARGPNDNPLANVAILQMIAMGAIRPSFSTHSPPDILALAKRCLAHNPDDRPSAPEVAYALRTATI